MYTKKNELNNFFSIKIIQLLDLKLQAWFLFIHFDLWNVI